MRRGELKGRDVTRQKEGDGVARNEDIDGLRGNWKREGMMKRGLVSFTSLSLLPD
tara:strand:- start:27033 stop:27197 length:165 start_codon:yes stop_codon:yes gene_type:complete